MGRARAYLAFVAIFLLAILLIVMGFEGSPGRMLAVVFAPGRLTVDESGQKERKASQSESGNQGGTVAL